MYIIFFVIKSSLSWQLQKDLIQKIEIFLFFQANSSSEGEDEVSPRFKEQINKVGFTDFCVKHIHHAEIGRKEIQIAEQGM